MSSISSGTTSTTTLVHSGDTTGSLVFKTNDTGSGGTTAMTIDTSQNVGIGTSSPSVRLQVDAGSSQETQRYNTSNTAPFVGWYVSGTRKAYQQWDASYGWIFDSEAASTGIIFRTQNTERMRIDSSGNLLVGLTSYTGAPGRITLTYGGGMYGIRIISGNAGASNAMQFSNNSNGEVGTINITGTNTTYNTSSDYRLKNTVTSMTGALSKVARLKPVTYKWNYDNSDGQGFIAHELQEVVPECVTGEKDAVDDEGNPKYQGIDTSFLVATLTAAIQELKAINDQQAQTITALTARIEALEKK